MARQIYRCPQHGEFDVDVSLTKDVPKRRRCPARTNRSYPSRCGLSSSWVLKPPGGVIIKGDRPIDPGFTRDAQQLAGEKLKAKQQKART